MVVEASALLAGEATVELVREAKFGAVACYDVLELVGKGAAGAEEKRFEGARRQVEDLGDLAVRAAFELAHDERLALALGDPLERPDEILHRRPAVICRVLRNVAVEFNFSRTGLLLTEALAHDVVGDGDQPVRGLPRPLAALERAEGVDKRCLGDVLCVGVVAENGVRVAIHLADVVPVEIVEGP